MVDGIAQNGDVRSELCPALRGYEQAVLNQSATGGLMRPGQVRAELRPDS
jgi:hypothetical protein